MARHYRGIMAKKEEEKEQPELLPWQKANLARKEKAAQRRMEKEKERKK